MIKVSYPPSRKVWPYTGVSIAWLSEPLRSARKLDSPLFSMVLLGTHTAPDHPP
jgi:hypothetical protein